MSLTSIFFMLFFALILLESGCSDTKIPVAPPAGVASGAGGGGGAGGAGAGSKTPVTAQPGAVPGSGFVMPTQCITLSGNYQMNMDNFTLTQEGCAVLTWTYKPQIVFGDDGMPARDANGNPIFTPEKKVTWTLDGQVHDGQRAYFQADGQALIVDKSDGSTDVYYLTVDHACDAIGTQGTYIVKQTFGPGDVELHEALSCSFWGRN